MNRKFVFRTTGKLLEALSVILLLPAVVSLIYRENSYISFLITAAIAFLIGFTLRHAFKTKNNVIYAKEGFLIVSLAWLSTSIIGALPFVISGEIPSYIDAFFESVSGFTTTGASILTDVESMSRGMLFWRSFTHWIGGMGVLVFIMAFVSNITDRSIHIMRAEMPGPIVGKIVPRVKDTSKTLYLMYIVLTVLEIIMLLFSEMDLFESVVHALGTAGTGGFGIKADSISSYSPYAQWVISVFMLLFGINFNLYYLLMIKRFKSVFKSTELWTYLGIVAASVLLISRNIYTLYENTADVFRTAFFQVSAIITTTGYATADFNLWPSFSKAILFLLMFTGACAGSTAGGLKLSRVIIIFKVIARELKKLIHPRSVVKVGYEGKELDENTQRSVTAYFSIYMVCILIVFLIISLDGFDFETNFSVAVSCFNNIGPAFSVAGPMGSYAGFSGFSKLVLSFAMLLGRLEIFPLLIAAIPSTWRKR